MFRPILAILLLTCLAACTAPEPTSVPTLPTRTPIPPTVKPTIPPTTEPGSASNTWFKIYGGNQDDVVGDVLLADDGGYFIVGTTDLEFEPQMRGHVYLIKIGADGQIQWERTYREDYRWGQTVMPSSEGGLMVSGWTVSTANGDIDIYLTQLDQNMDEAWTETFSGPLDEMGSAWQMPDGGYLIGGNIVDPNDFVADPGAPGYGGLAGRSNIYIARTDSDGNKLWSHAYGEENNVLAASGVRTSDGGFIILGTIMYYPDIDDDMYLLRVDKNGDQVWSRTWEEGTINSYNLIPTSDGNYLITGSYSSAKDTERSTLDFIFTKVDPQGNELWTRTFGDPNMIDYASVVTETADGGYIAAGNRVTSFTSNDENIVIVRLDPNGQLLWEQQIETNRHNMFTKIFQHPDGGYVIVGSTFQGRSLDIFMVKTDAEGNVNQ